MTDFVGEVTQIRIFQRTTPLLKFTVRKPPETHGDYGEAWDLTDATVTFDAKAEITDTAKLFSKTCTITNAAGGKCEVRLSQTDTDYDGIMTAELEVVYTTGPNSGQRFVRQFQIWIEPTVGE